MMMKPRIVTEYSKTGQYEAVRLNCEGREYHVTAILPKMTANLADGLELMQNIKFSLNEIELHMPSFEGTSNFELKEPLQEMGIKSIFEPSNDMKRMIDSPGTSFVSRIIHKVFIKVDETGITAAAATAEVLETCGFSMDREPVKTKVVFDRPFVFVISHKRNGAVLFAGVVTKPDTFL
jgi:serpin B